VHQASVTLRPHVTEVARARQRVARFCGGLPADLTSIAQLLTSELVSTAVAGSAEPVHLHLTLARSGLRVEVTGRSSTPAVHDTPTRRGDPGPGLMIVERLASAWGIQPNTSGPGRTVWFTLRTADRGPS
jgi:hypothetical protein